MHVRFLFSIFLIIFAVAAAIGSQGGNKLSGIYNQSISCQSNNIVITAYTKDLRNDFILGAALPWDPNTPFTCCQKRAVADGFLSWTLAYNILGHYDFAVMESRNGKGDGYLTVATFSCDLN